MSESVVVVPANAPIQVEGAEGATNMLQLITVRSALKFEIRTGMKMTRQSALVVAQRITGCKRSKKVAWEAVNDIIAQVRPDMDESANRPW